MPAVRFWLLHRNIDRVAAEEQLRLLDVGIGSTSGEGYKEISKTLREQMGDVVEMEGRKKMSVPAKDELDRDGLAMLKAIQHQKIGQYVQGL